MADKTNFTKDEWALLLRSPMNAGMAVTAAEPSGLFGPSQDPLRTHRCLIAGPPSGGLFV
jgi:ferredoxin-NADP reductase